MFISLTLTGPFDNQTQIYHLKTRLIWVFRWLLYSDPAWISMKEMGAVTYFFVNKTLSHDGSHGSTEWAKIVKKFQEPVGVAYHFFISEKQNKKLVNDYRQLFWLLHFWEMVKYKDIEVSIEFSPIVVCCCKLNNTWYCDKHLFELVGTPTGLYQLSIVYHSHNAILRLICMSRKGP